jgi:hypothetical protein
MTDDRTFARAAPAARDPGGDGGTRGDEVPAPHDTMRCTGQSDRRLLVEYRCTNPAACLLARVYATPRGMFVHQPAYIVSAAVAAERGIGWGGRLRPEAAYLMPDRTLEVPLVCDHRRGALGVTDVLEDVSLARRTGRPTGRRISSDGSGRRPSRPVPSEQAGDDG